MADTFNKKEREKKKELKRKEKLSRKEYRKENSGGGGLESMMAYVDENGAITNTPPDPKAKIKIDVNSIEIGIPKKEDREEVDSTLSGTVNFYDDSKGYGFIKSDDGENYFMHNSNINKGQPIKGRKATFEKERGSKGWVAVRINIE